jgi:hypothetical protein
MKRGRFLAGALALTLGLIVARPARAAYGDDAGWGALAVLGNVVYMPVKITYAALGGLTGGLAFAFTGGDLETAERIWVASLGGTYVLTPPMLRGEAPIAFAGMPDDGQDRQEEVETVYEFREQPLKGAEGSDD